MGNLIYSAIASLDGYIEDKQGGFESADAIPDRSPAERDFTTIWKGAEKIVFSRSLDNVSSARTRIEREFDPGSVRRLKTATDYDITVSGAELAERAITSGLVDELQLLTVPILVGGGKRWLPDGIWSDLELLDTRRFGNGVVFLRYRVNP